MEKHTNIALRNDVRMKGLLAGVVGLCAFSIYIPTLQSGFIWDDIVMFLNPIKMGTHPYAFFIDKGVYYRPFVHLSMAFDYHFWDMNATGYHITNVVFHVVNSVLVYILGLTLFRGYQVVFSEEVGERGNVPGSALLAFAAAMIFAIHPVHAEPVAWIAGRTDLMATCFSLLSIISFVIYHREGKTIAIMLSSLFLLFGLFSKENAVSVVGIALVWGLLQKMPKKKIYISLCSFAAVGILYFILRSGFYTIGMFMESPGTGKAFFAGGTSFLKIIALGVGYYLEKLVVPLNLSVLPPLPETPVGIVYVLVFLAAGFIVYVGRKRLELFFWAWICITLAPSLPILFSRLAWPLAERYLYLPSVGFSILVVMALSRIRNLRIMVMLFGALCVFYIYGTYEAVQEWKNDVTVWENAVEKNPRSAVARLNYGSVLFENEKWDRAEEELLAALEQEYILSDQVSAANDTLGVIALSRKNYDESREYFIKSIKADPGNETAYSNLGLLYAKIAILPTTDERERKEYFKAAVINFENALKLSGNFIIPKFNLGLCYYALDRYDKAEEYFISVIESAPQSDYAMKAAGVLKRMQNQANEMSTGENKEKVHSANPEGR